MDFFRRSNWDLIGRTWLWFGISLIVLLGGAVSGLVRGMNYGIDFTGGSLLKFEFERPLVAGGVSEAEVMAETRTMLQERGLEKTQIQVSGGNQLFIRTAEKEETRAVQQEQEVRQALQELFGDHAGTVRSVGRDMVGPIVGKQLRNTAILALILGSILILIYIALRYEFRFGVAAVIALIHDVLIVIGAMALFRAELNTEFIAALLTVIGYSVNDSVVIFDRIRENMRLHRGGRFANIVNTSLLQTMTRSINTTMSTLFALVALFFFGGPAIHAFSLAMIVGIATGAYSSIFIASPIVVLWGRGKVQAVQRERRPAYASASAADQAPTRELVAGQVQEAPTAEEAIQRAKQEAQEEKRSKRRLERKQRRAKGSKKRH